MRDVVVKSVDNPTVIFEDVDSIWRSENFLNPVVCVSAETDSFQVSNGILDFNEYEKFW